MKNYRDYKRILKKKYIFTTKKKINILALKCCLWYNNKVVGEWDDV